MNTRFLFIPFVLIATLLIDGCNSKAAPALVVPEEAQAGDLTGLTACEFQPAGRKTTYAAECGSLAVPENWEVPGSRLIALPVVRIPARGPNPAEPVFFIQGGPGHSNLSWTPPEWLLENHEVVMVGYRGMEGTVTLACPEVNRLIKKHAGKDLFSERARTEYTAAANQCVATLHEAGIDLSGYTVPGVIRDMEAARRAMGYDRINLFSQSYGTRVAQIYAYMYPDSLRRLVLIGVSTPGSFIDNPVVLDEMIRHISELCAQDVACSRRTTDFAQTLYDVNHHMPKRWLFFKIDPDTVRLGTHFAFMSNLMMPMVFEAYLAAGEGDPSGLAMANLYVPMQPIDQQVFGDQSNKAGTLDRDKYEGIESVSLGDSIMGGPLSELFWPMAVDWPIQLIPKDLREFQETDVEMLLINGTLDFATPPTALDKARPYFHKAQMVLLPEFSHTGDVQSLQPQAFQRLITSYYDTGVADSSLFVYQPLSFEPGMSLVKMARLLVAAMLILPALIVLGFVLVVRHIRQRRMVA